MKSTAIKLVENNGTLGVNVQIQFLNSKNLTSGAKYQRPLDHKKIEKIISTFDEHKFGFIRVSFRDGKYWVYDGQHRVMVLKALNKGQDCLVPCEIHYGLTYEDEARLFAEQYDGATKVDIAFQLNALVEAQDVETLKIKEIVESTGLELPFNKAKGDNKVIANSKVRSIYRDIKEEGLKRTLQLIKSTWDGSSMSLDKEIIGGVYMFIKTYKTSIDDNIFIRQLSRVSPKVIKRDGNSDLSAKSDLRFAKQIRDIYNGGIRGKENKLEYKFKG